MRIQETDEILKESRYARKHAAHAKPGMLGRLWRSVLGLFGIR